MNFKEDDVILCAVKKIEGTTVFLETEDEAFPGTMVLSEVAAGRIRNLRVYVTPNKKIVCKILKVSKDHLELSLRRVTAKEREEILEEYKKDRALRNMLKIIGENPDKIIRKIKETYSVTEFLEEVKKDSKILNNLISEEKAKKLYQIITEKEERDKIVNKKIVLKTLSEQGVSDIKEILNIKNCEIHYLGSSVFSISTSGKDFKEANNKLSQTIEEIAKKAKSKKAIFEMKQK